MFVARGFALRRLRTLSSSGDPQSRQQGLLGTASAIAFPQNSLSVLQALPTSAEHLSDYLSIFFTDATISNLRLAKEFIVRRSAVHSALTWLVSHNPYYADVQIDPNALGQLPVNEIPPAWLAVAQATEQTVERCLGPADASSVDTALPSSIHAAVLTPGEDASDPLHLWDTALTACQRYERRSTNSSTDPSCHVHLAQEALRQLLSMSDHHTFHVDSRHQTSPSNQRQNLCVSSSLRYSSGQLSSILLDSMLPMLVPMGRQLGRTSTSSFPHGSCLGKSSPTSCRSST